LRIVHLTGSVTRSAGGLYYSVSGLSKALQQRGHDVTVVGASDANYEQDKGQWGDVPVIHSSASGYGFRRELLTKARALRPDVYHVQGIWSAVTVSGLWASRGQAGTVVSPRGMCDPWILARSPLRKKVHGALFERPLLRRSVAHALCESERISIAAYVPGTRIEVVPNGIDGGPAEAPDLSGKSGTLYLGRLHEKKQTVELVKAWEAGPGRRGEQLTIAGWGSPAYEEKLRKLVDEAPNVGFVGSAYGEAKASLLREARFFILPSLSEGLPMAVLEALSYGAIPIITDECNLPELIVDGTAISLREDLSNLDAIYLGQTKRSGSALTDHSAACMTRSEDYRWSAIAEKMEAIYEAAVEVAGRRG